MYHQSTALAAPSDPSPVVALVSAAVSSAGPPPMVPAVVRHHVVPTHTAQMVLFAQAMCIPAQVTNCSDVVGDHLEECVYLHEA